eukprot:9073055-Pyramimonas_sp.AAC.1
MVRAIEYDMAEMPESCVTLHALLTDADPATCPAAGATSRPELIDLEDGQGGPRGERYFRSEEALATALNLNVDSGPPDKPVEVHGLAARPGPDDPELPTPSG